MKRTHEENLAGASNKRVKYAEGTNLEQDPSINDLVENIINIALEGDEEALRKLISIHGKHIINTKDEINNCTAVEFLASNDNTDAVNLLLNYGASKDKAIYASAKEGAIGLVWQLLKKGASPDWAIKGAAENHDIELVHYLINMGANEKYAVYGFAESGFIPGIQHILSHGGELTGAAKPAGIGGNRQMISFLISQGANINHITEGAAVAGNIPLLNELIKLGASREYAFIGFAEGGHVEGIEYMLSQELQADRAGISVSMADDTNIMEYLQSIGADINSMLKIAINNKQEKFVKWLLQHGGELKQAVTMCADKGFYDMAIKLLSLFKFPTSEFETIYQFLSQDFIITYRNFFDSNSFSLKNGSLHDMYFYYVESKCIEHEVTTSLASFLSAFYFSYSIQRPLNPTNTNIEILIPHDVLEEIAYLVIEPPKAFHAALPDYQEVSPSVVRAITSKWLEKIGDIRNSGLSQSPAL